VPPEALDTAEEVEAQAGTPEDDLLRREQVDRLRRALGAVPPALREAVVARVLEGEEYEAVAARQGVPPATARTRVHRGLAWLRRLLEGARGLVPVVPSFTTASTAVVAPAVFALAMASPPGGAVIAETAVVAPTPAVAGAPAAAGALLVARAQDDRLPAKEPRRGVAPRPSRGGSPPAASKAASPPPAVERFDYADDEVEGSLERPGEELLQAGPRRVRPPSLLEIPSSFVAAIVKMAEEL
jgi:hypothetical protein